MSFSAAVLNLLEAGEDQAALEPRHARDYVRKRYLEDTDLASERSALLDVAAVAELEGFFPCAALPTHSLEKTINRGIVWLESRGSRRFSEGYRIPHPGLGTLLRAAGGGTESSHEARCRVLARHPEACILLVNLVLKRSDEDEAAGLLSALWGQSDWPIGGLPVNWWRATLEATQRLGVLSQEEIEERSNRWLAKESASTTLYDLATGSTLDSLRSFFGYATATFPNVSQMLLQSMLNNSDAAARVAITNQLPGSCHS